MQTVVSGKYHSASASVYPLLLTVNTPYLGCGPVAVTTRIVSFSGDPILNLHLPTAIGRWPHPSHHIHHIGLHPAIACASSCCKRARSAWNRQGKQSKLDDSPKGTPQWRSKNPSKIGENMQNTNWYYDLYLYVCKTNIYVYIFIYISFHLHKRQTHEINSQSHIERGLNIHALIDLSFSLSKTFLFHPVNVFLKEEKRIAT